MRFAVFNGGTERAEAKSDVSLGKKSRPARNGDGTGHTQMMVPSCLNISEAAVFLIGSQQKVEVD